MYSQFVSKLKLLIYCVSGFLFEDVSNVA